MALQLEPVPVDTPRGLRAWLANQFRLVAAELNGPLMAQQFGAEPQKPRAGTIVYAIDPWASTLAGEGFYGYEAGAWVKL